MPMLTRINEHADGDPHPSVGVEIMAEDRVLKTLWYRTVISQCPDAIKDPHDPCEPEDGSGEEEPTLHRELRDKHGQCRQSSRRSPSQGTVSGADRTPNDIQVRITTADAERLRLPITSSGAAAQAGARFAQSPHGGSAMSKRKPLDPSPRPIARRLRDHTNTAQPNTVAPGNGSPPVTGGTRNTAAARTVVAAEARVRHFGPFRRSWSPRANPRSSAFGPAAAACR